MRFTGFLGIELLVMAANDGAASNCDRIGVWRNDRQTDAIAIL